MGDDGDMILRPHQEKMISDTRQALKRHRRVLLQGPTGVGKTVLASFMARQHAGKGGRVFFVCHRRELLDQTSGTFQANDIEHALIAAGKQPNYYVPVQIASIDTLKNRIEKIPAPSLVIWDECHHLGAAGWTKVQSAYPDTYHIGLSATPERLDGKGLNKHFDVLVPGPNVADLIDNGYLAQYKLYSVPGADLAGVHTRMGDFVKSETELVMDTSSIMGGIVRHWRKYASDKLTIAFGVTRAHSQHIAAQFRANGINSIHLDGETPKHERRAGLQALARGDIRVVCNVGLFGEGYDLAANSGMDVAVGCVIDAAPTQSLGAFLQRCGRALRPQEGRAVILDHAGNAQRHGLPCDIREWSLEGRKAREGSSGESLGIKQCPECFHVQKIGKPACLECGHVFEIQAREIEEIDGELQEIDPAVARRERKREQGEANSLEALIELGRERGYKSPERWAGHIWKARQSRRSAA